MCSSFLDGIGNIVRHQFRHHFNTRGQDILCKFGSFSHDKILGNFLFCCGSCNLNINSASSGVLEFVHQAALEALKCDLKYRPTRDLASRHPVTVAMSYGLMPICILFGKNRYVVCHERLCKSHPCGEFTPILRSHDNQPLNLDQMHCNRGS